MYIVTLCDFKIERPGAKPVTLESGQLCDLMAADALRAVGQGAARYATPGDLIAMSSPKQEKPTEPVRREVAHARKLGRVAASEEE